jgi:hypothetical protein
MTHDATKADSGRVVSTIGEMGSDARASRQPALSDGARQPLARAIRGVVGQVGCIAAAIGRTLASATANV